MEVSKAKTGSSSSASSDSSEDSEDSEHGDKTPGHTPPHPTSQSGPRLTSSSILSPLPGLVPKQQQKQKKAVFTKDTKRPHHPSFNSVGGPPVPPHQPQVVQSKPLFSAPPALPLPVPAPSLDSSQLLGSGFDPLAHFLNPHLAQSKPEPTPTVSTAGGPAPPGPLNAQAHAAPPPAETHPFLNQHTILPSPGTFHLNSTGF